MYHYTTLHPPDSPRSPIEPRVLFSPGSDSSAGKDEASSHGGGDHSEEMAPPATTVEISAEGDADDTYMLAMCATTPMLMLQATGQWTTLTGQEINGKKSLAFAVQHTARGTQEARDVELNGETLPKEHELRQLGIGVRMHPKRGRGPLLTKRVQEAQAALEKSRSLPLGFDGRASIAAVMIIAAALYEVELADISKKTVAALESTVMYALWACCEEYWQGHCG